MVSAPASTSGVSSPRVRLSTSSNSTFIGNVSASAVRFQFAAISDGVSSSLGSWHTPAECAGSTPELGVDCVDAGCTGLDCNYTVTLSTTGAVTLQVRWGWVLNIPFNLRIRAGSSFCLVVWMCVDH